MSRTERRAKAAEASEQPMWAAMTLTGFGIDNVPGSATKWFAYRCDTAGNVVPLTPLYDGKLRGEAKHAATQRAKDAWARKLGGFS